LVGKILGVDHLCATCLDIEKGKDLFTKLGFETRFTEFGLPVAKEKLPILSSKILSHDATFLKNKTGISLELINHDYTQNSGKFQVIYKGSVDNSDFSVIENDLIVNRLKDEFENKLIKIFHPQLELTLYQSKLDDGNGINSIILQSDNISKASNFWINGLGFKISKVSEKHNWKLLEYASPVQNWSIKLYLIENKNLPKSNTYLNSKGWTCVSLITTKIEPLLSELKNQGVKFCGTPYDYEIGNKRMRLVFVRGYEEELIELIQFY